MPVEQRPVLNEVVITVCEAVAISLARKLGQVALLQSRSPPNDLNTA
jgi:hypothetical protein